MEDGAFRYASLVDIINLPLATPQGYTALNAICNYLQRNYDKVYPMYELSKIDEIKKDLSSIDDDFRELDNINMKLNTCETFLSNTFEYVAPD